MKIVTKLLLAQVLGQVLVVILGVTAILTDQPFADNTFKHYTDMPMYMGMFTGLFIFIAMMDNRE